MAKIIDRRGRSMGGGSKRKVSQIKNIAVHYSATSTGNTASFERFWKGTHGWSTGGYHEVILTNGDVELNYNADTISNGVGGQNTRMYNICYVGDSKPNVKQLESLKERVNYNRNRFNISVSNVKGHREFEGQSTDCPGLNMGEFRKSLGGGSVTPAKPKVKTATSHTKVTKKSSNDLGLVDWMKSQRMDSSFGNRKKLAKRYGISNYSGTAAQNTKLLKLLRSGSKPKKNNNKGSSNANTLKVGSKVKIKSSAGNYSRTSTSIPSKWKNKNLTIQQVAKNDVLLQEVYSWVRKSDLVGGGSTTSKSKKTKTLKVGNTVTLKKSATHFATGQSILSSAKGKRYKIIQVKSDRVLLDNIMSWVKKSDVQ